MNLVLSSTIRSGFFRVWCIVINAVELLNVQASSSLVSSRKGADGKLDYSHINVNILSVWLLTFLFSFADFILFPTSSNVKVELQTVDGLVKDSTQCAPNGYYFIPVYDKVFIIILNILSCGSVHDVVFGWITVASNFLCFLFVGLIRSQD